VVLCSPNQTSPTTTWASNSCCKPSRNSL
jgi:hypothetical protein